MCKHTKNYIEIGPDLFLMKVDIHELAECLINCAHIEHKSNCKLAASNDFCKKLSQHPHPALYTFHWPYPV